MFSHVLAFLDLSSLVWAWLNQWCYILSMVIQNCVLPRAEGIATQPNDFWYVSVFVGLLSMFVTNVQDAVHFYKDNRLFLALLSSVDLVLPYLAVTQFQEFAQGGAPDIRGVRRRNGLWRGLPCAATSVFIATRGMTQTFVCDYMIRLETNNRDYLSKARDVGLSNTAYIHEDELKMIETEFGAKCPRELRSQRRVNTFEEFQSAAGLMAARKEDVKAFTGSTAFQFAIREYAAQSVLEGVSGTSAGPLATVAMGGDSPTLVARTILRIQNDELQHLWASGGGRSRSVAIFADPHSLLLLAQAAAQLLVAAKGVVAGVREQRKLPPIAAAALYLHSVMDAFLAIGCLVTVFTIIPTENAFMRSRDAFEEEIKAVATGPLGGLLADVVGFMPADQRAAINDEYLLPTLKPSVLRLFQTVIDGMSLIHSPRPACELRSAVALLVVGAILYGAARLITGRVGASVFVASPAVAADDERVEPIAVLFQMFMRAAAALSPFIIAASTWAEFRTAVALVIGLLIQYKFTCAFALGAFLTVYAVTGIIAVTHLNDAMCAEGCPESELLSFPRQQGCCGAERKNGKNNNKKKRAPGASGARPGHDVEEGYGACWQ